MKTKMTPVNSLMRDTDKARQERAKTLKRTKRKHDELEKSVEEPAAAAAAEPATNEAGASADVVKDETSLREEEVNKINELIKTQGLNESECTSGLYELYGESRSKFHLC